ncbi:MAG: type II toxin-antitoxin system Phd/YefM family antitoxin [Nitrospinae bacterium]|nr:type II toxin-antitoxin system Phd/YefM family antitoxin [Nitrospinota bacterium]MBF0634258.1 type II toxin-antitoxin system Phd/YefM family antitoxin [Nitrospinota bacterium]
MSWQLQSAKNKLSEVVSKASTEGPQVITVRGKETAVILSIEDFRKLKEPQGSLVEFFRRSPLAGSGIVVERSRDTGRSVKL